MLITAIRRSRRSSDLRRRSKGAGAGLPSLDVRISRQGGVAIALRSGKDGRITPGVAEPTSHSDSELSEYPVRSFFGQWRPSCGLQHCSTVAKCRWASLRTHQSLRSIASHHITLAGGRSDSQGSASAAAPPLMVPLTGRWASRARLSLCSSPLSVDPWMVKLAPKS